MRLSLLFIILLCSASSNAEFQARREGYQLILTTGAAREDISAGSVTRILASFLKAHNDWLFADARLAGPLSSENNIVFPLFFVHPMMFIEDGSATVEHHLNRAFFPRQNIDPKQ